MKFSAAIISFIAAAGITTAIPAPAPAPAVSVWTSTSIHTTVATFTAAPEVDSGDEDLDAGKAPIQAPTTTAVATEPMATDDALELVGQLKDALSPLVIELISAVQGGDTDKVKTLIESLVTAAGGDNVATDALCNVVDLLGGATGILSLVTTLLGSLGGGLGLTGIIGSLLQFSGATISGALNILGGNFISGLLGSITSCLPGGNLVGGLLEGVLGAIGL